MERLGLDDFIRLFPHPLGKTFAIFRDASQRPVAANLQRQQHPVQHLQFRRQAFDRFGFDRGFGKPPRSLSVATTDPIEKKESLSEEEAIAYYAEFRARFESTK